MKLFGVYLQESRGDGDDGSSDNENMQKTKQVADDSAEKKISNESNSKSTDGDSTITRVIERKKKRVADDSVAAVPAQNLEGESHDALDTREKDISNDDSAITRVDDRKKKRVADDDDHHAVDAVIPLFLRLWRADDSVEASDTRVDDRKRKRVADDAVDEEQLPLKNRLFRANDNASEQQSSDNENTQKMKQVADDSAVEALDTRVDDRKKKQVADDAVGEVLQPSAAAVALPRPKFHPRILEANGNKPPTFLFKRRFDSVCVTPQGNDILNDRCYLVSYAQIENELSERETRMLCLNLATSPVRVIATDQKGVDYEFRLSWEGVSVTPWEWMRLVAENGLKERDAVEGSVYWVGGQFHLALSISSSNFL